MKNLKRKWHIIDVGVSKRDEFLRAGRVAVIGIPDSYLFRIQKFRRCTGEKNQIFAQRKEWNLHSSDSGQIFFY